MNAVRAHDLLDAAELAISELVTNAVVHAGTEIAVRIRAVERALRVEIEDGSTRLPVLRDWSASSGTGRGLHIVNESADRWDVEPAVHGKTVWFEIGRFGDDAAAFPAAATGTVTVPEDVVEVTLLDVPLLMHRAWQEHAATLLRDYLLHALDEDPGALDEHAAASDALGILGEQMPVPTMPADPDALMASSVEPGVTAEQVVLRIPRASVAHIAVLDDVLARAAEAAEQGYLLVPPTQPEIQEMRHWLCGQVAEQAAGTGAPRPWRASLDVRAALDGPESGGNHRELGSAEEPQVVTDQRYVIVAATAAAVRFLGYRDQNELLGRRILVVIPARYHQAHIAGTTFHVIDERDVLLNRWITVPVVRADGAEVPVDLRVEPRRLDDDSRIYIATFRPR